MKKLVRSAVSAVTNATFDRSMRIAKRNARLMKSLGKRMKDVGHFVYVVGRAQVEELELVEAGREEYIALSVDFYSALLTGDKEELARILTAQFEKGMAKARTKPPAWATDMNAN